MDGLMRTDRKTPTLEAIYEPIAAELAEFEGRFAANFSGSYEFIRAMMAYINGFAGKRLRPALVFFSGKAVGGDIVEDHFKLAQAVELIHTGTLLHDDVLDDADQRRRVMSANRKYDNELSILLGDLLLAHAYRLSLTFKQEPLCKALGHATASIIEGELLQMHNRWQYDLSEKTYFDIIGQKTASICGFCASMGAFLGGAPQDVYGAYEQFGNNLGIAFQIIDDYLDIVGEEDVAGKTLGTDLEKGKPTLPLIKLLDALPEEDRGDLIRALSGSDKTEMMLLVKDRMSEFAIPEQVLDTASAYIEKAKDALRAVPGAALNESMFDLADYVLLRRK